MSQVSAPVHRPFFSLHQLSDEQVDVVNAVVFGRCNVIVNAVAGSGKTRTALVTAMEWISSRISAGEGRFAYINRRVTPMVLLVAYNRLLMEDMVKQRDECVPEQLRDYIEIRTIHGLGHQYFGGEGLTTDRDLYRWMENNARPMRPFSAYQLVMIDEAQDLTPILFNFLHFVLSQLKRPLLLILGDPFQLLYRFKGADERFILEAHERFADVVAAAPFKRFKLSICFRITHEMAQWINLHLNPNNLNRAMAPSWWRFEDYRQQIADWWGTGIRANPQRPSAPGSVTFCNGYEPYTWPRYERVINEMIDVLVQYDSNSFALLASSLSDPNSPARTLTNNLRFVGRVEQSWFIDRSDSQHEGSHRDIRRNKRVASTIHKFKGRECDAIVLVGFDNYMESRGTSDPRDLFNIFYVAATRARKRLHIIQWNSQAFATHMSRTGAPRPMSRPLSRCLVTRVLEYCGYDPILCEESPTCLTARTTSRRAAYRLSADEYTVPGSNHAHQKGTLENISDIMGLAIEIRLQLILDNGKLTVPSPRDDEENKIDPDLRDYLLNLAREAQSRNYYSWADVMKISTAYLTLGDGYHSRWRQIRNFSRWTIVRSSSKLDKIIMNLISLLYVPFCAEELTGEWDVSLEGGLSQDENAMLQTFDNIPYEQKLDALKSLRKEGRILFHGILEFSMQPNHEFALKFGESLMGEMDIILISKEMVRNLNKVRKYRAASYARRARLYHLSREIGEGRIDSISRLPVDVEKIMPFINMSEMKTVLQDAISQVNMDGPKNDGDSVAEWAYMSGDGTGVTIVEVKATSRADHDHMLQLGCYGSIWRENKQISMNGFRPQKPEPFSTDGFRSQKPELFSMDDDEIINLVLHETKETLPLAALLQTNDCVKIPKMFLVYPNLGLLRQVQLGMDSEEYLHRIGFRKINKPFDPNILHAHQVSNSQTVSRGGST